jgi:hypothetical protein
MAKTDEQRVANYLWTLLGKPDEFDNEETGAYWALTIRECMGETEFDRVGFKRFLDWVLNMNPRSAEYMRKAKDPVATLKKNLPTLFKFYGAFQAAQSAAVNAKKSISGKVDDRPTYRKESGKGVFKDSGL